MFMASSDQQEMHMITKFCCQLGNSPKKTLKCCNRHEQGIKFSEFKFLSGIEGSVMEGAYLIMIWGEVQSLLLIQC